MALDDCALSTEQVAVVKNYANNYKVLRGGAKALTELDGIEAGVTEQVKQLKEHVMDGIALETVRTAHPVTTAPPPAAAPPPFPGFHTLRGRWTPRTRPCLRCRALSTR